MIRALKIETQHDAASDDCGSHGASNDPESQRLRPTMEYGYPHRLPTTNGEKHCPEKCRAPGLVHLCHVAIQSGRGTWSVDFAATCPRGQGANAATMGRLSRRHRGRARFLRLVGSGRGSSGLQKRVRHGSGMGRGTRRAGRCGMTGPRRTAPSRCCQSRSREGASGWQRFSEATGRAATIQPVTFLVCPAVVERAMCCSGRNIRIPHGCPGQLSEQTGH